MSAPNERAQGLLSRLVVTTQATAARRRPSRSGFVVRLAATAKAPAQHHHAIGCSGWRRVRSI